ncbi:hypothetical protein GQR58_018638 [Nymphon striatum]|nr:hypothetical protein GQR58_018638 [Nymphon striatum]
MAEEKSPANSVTSGDNHKKKRKKKKNSKTDGTVHKKEKMAFFDKVKGSVLARCLWTACRAVVIGFLLILIGAAMATLGFYAKVLSTTSVHKAKEEGIIFTPDNLSVNSLTLMRALNAALNESTLKSTLNAALRSDFDKIKQTGGNVTAFVVDEIKYMHLDNLTYVGPCIMGIGGVIIVGACVMTFEARDTAAKITPWFKLPSWASSRYTKVELHPPGGQTFCTDVKLLCNPTVELEVAKLRMKADLLVFRDKVQNSIDSVDLTAKHKNGKLQRSSTDPNLAAEAGKTKVHQINAKDYCISLATKQKIDSSNTLHVNQQKFLRRQALSVDYNPEFHPVHRSYSNSSATHKMHKRGDSGDSMVMDLYLPQGSVTLKIRDTSKSGGSSSSLQKTRSPSESSQEHRRSLSPRTLSYVSPVSQKVSSNCLSPNSDDGLAVTQLAQRTASELHLRDHLVSKDLVVALFSSEDGSIGLRHPNLSVQSGSYSSQESYTILESPHEGGAEYKDREENDVVVELDPQPVPEKNPVKRFQSVQDQRPCEQRSEEGQRRAGQYRSKTESAKRHPFLRQSAVDS